MLISKSCKILILLIALVNINFLKNIGKPRNFQLYHVLNIFRMRKITNICNIFLGKRKGRPTFCIELAKLFVCRLTLFLYFIINLHVSISIHILILIIILAYLNTVSILLNCRVVFAIILKVAYV